MNSKLRSMIAYAGLIILSGTSFVVYRALPGVTQADLVDAGIGSCLQGEALCQVRYLDGGYDRLRVRGDACEEPDGSYAVIPGPDVMTDVELVRTHDGAPCERATGPNKLKAQDKRLKEPDKCACAPIDGGICTLTDGGHPGNNTLYPGQFTGSGCVPKSCGEMAGQSSWPEACIPE